MRSDTHGNHGLQTKEQNSQAGTESFPGLAHRQGVTNQSALELPRDSLGAGPLCAPTEGTHRPGSTRRQGREPASWEGGAAPSAHSGCWGHWDPKALEEPSLKKKLGLREAGRWSVYSFTHQASVDVASDTASCHRLSAATRPCNGKAFL